ncbi:acyl-CoA N-acyltransferase [Russula brevipes]|nr:acyl-CoA N-acyltransferase [Russula brevipes]
MDTITYRPYSGEHELPHIISLVQGELSEPYVVYTYRYFLHQWPHLPSWYEPHCHPPTHKYAYDHSQAYAEDVPHPVGVIVCKQSPHRERYLRGYIAMLSVDKGYRKRGIASTLVRHSIRGMQTTGAQEIVLETEFDNVAALALYTSLGFVPEKRLHRFYLNGKDAFRLVLPLAGAEDAAAATTAPGNKPRRAALLPPPGAGGSDDDENDDDVDGVRGLGKGLDSAPSSSADEDDYAEDSRNSCGSVAVSPRCAPAA